MPGYPTGCYKSATLMNPVWADCDNFCNAQAENSFQVSVENQAKADSIAAVIYNSSWFTDNSTSRQNIWVGGRDRDNDDKFYWLGTEHEANDTSVWYGSTSSAKDCVYLRGQHAKIDDWYCDTGITTIKGCICQLF